MKSLSLGIAALLLVSSSSYLSDFPTGETGEKAALMENEPRKSNPPPSLHNSQLKKTSEKPSQQETYASAFDPLPIKKFDGTTHREDSRSTPEAEIECKSTVYRAITALPNSHTKHLEFITLFYTEDGRRGLSSENFMVLRCLNVAQKELVGVFIHELGHIVDMAYKGADYPTEFEDFGDPIYEDDPSVQFYRISWLDSEETKENVSPLDFVSGYAMSDPFEDFAESYVYYVLHGPEFRFLMAKNEVLQKKYQILKNDFFDGQEFELSKTFSANRVFERYRNYDATTLDFDLNDFFAHEKTTISNRTF